MAALGFPPPVPRIFSTMEEGPRPGEAAPGEAWLETHGRALGHLVAGTWLKPPGRGALECREAASGRLLATVPRGEEADVAVAVEAATAAAEKWGGLGGPRRARHLQKLAAALAAGAAGLRAVAALAGGRPLARTLGVDLELRGLRAAAAAAQLGPPDLAGWVPLGVVAVVVSGSCSLGELLGVLGPLLAMGNAALVLPPAEAALLPLLLGELSTAGDAPPLPPGLLNVVTGTPCLRRALRRHPQIAAVAFLGSPQEEAAWGSPYRGPRLLRASRGGRVAVIVLDSADLDSAAAAVAASVGASPFPWGGCVVLVQEGGVAAALERRLRARLGALRVGDPLDPGTDVGPLPPTVASDAEALVQAAREEGAEVFQPPVTPPAGGSFYPPTLLTGVAPTSRCLRELGPVLALVPVRSPGEAVTVATGLPHVAAASVWAQDVTLALDTADRLPLGMVWINAIDPPELAGGFNSLEVLWDFGRPPWDSPPKPLETPLEQEPSLEPVPGGAAVAPDSVAAAVDAARRAAGGWGVLPAAGRAQVLRGAAAALGGDDDGDGDDEDERVRAALLRWAAHVELPGGAVQELPGGRVLLRRRPLGVVGVAWSGPRPLGRALRLLPPALALGNALVVTAPPGGRAPALRLRKALVAAGLPAGALAVLPGGPGGAGATLGRHRPDALWLCGGGTDPDWASTGSVAHVWVPGGVLGEPGRDPPGAERELELRCTRPCCLWVPGGGA